MLVIVSVSRLGNDRIEIGVARPQHDSNPTHNYPPPMSAIADAVRWAEEIYERG